MSNDNDNVSGILGIDADKINHAAALVVSVALHVNGILADIRGRGLTIEPTKLGPWFSITIRIPEDPKEAP